MRNDLVEDLACPACKAPRGEACNTVVNGVQTNWTHDARYYAKLLADIRAIPRGEPDA